MTPLFNPGDHVLIKDKWAINPTEGLIVSVTIPLNDAIEYEVVYSVKDVSRWNPDDIVNEPESYDRINTFKEYELTYPANLRHMVENAVNRAKREGRQETCIGTQF